MKVALDVDVSLTPEGQVECARIGDLAFNVVGRTKLTSQKFAEPFAELRINGVLIIGLGSEATFLRTNQKLISSH